MPKISPAAQRARIEERKVQILNAAAQVFAEKGFERATIAAIARQAGLAEGSIYNYFKNKSELLVNVPRQIVQPPLERVSAQMREMSLAESDSPEQVLSVIPRTMLATLRHNIHIFRVLLSTLPAMKPAQREKYAEQVIRYATSLLEGYFSEQIDKGILRDDLNPAIATRVFIGMFFPFIIIQELFEFRSLGSFQDDEIIAQAVGIFLHGASVEKSPPGEKRIPRTPRGKTK